MQQGLFVYKYSYSLDACDSSPNSSSSVYSGLIRGSIATPSPSMSSSEHKKKGLTTVKTILNGISGSAAPGEILALMGPSGSGKTSMLDVLSGRSSYDGGSITLDGEIVTDKVMKKLKKRVAYVKQSDLFFGHLTVRDQLVYTAFLRLPNAWSKAQKIGEVDRIIRQASNVLQRVCWHHNSFNNYSFANFSPISLRAAASRKMSTLTYKYDQWGRKETSEHWQRAANRSIYYHTR